MTPVIACANCKRLRQSALRWPSCDAFPEGIPEDIAFGKNQHREPFPGDNGLLWEEKHETT